MQYAPVEPNNPLHPLIYAIWHCQHITRFSSMLGIASSPIAKRIATVRTFKLEFTVNTITQV